jgi:hypothetical protein
MCGDITAFRVKEAIFASDTSVLVVGIVISVLVICKASKSYRIKLMVHDV